MATQQSDPMLVAALLLDGQGGAKDLDADAVTRWTADQGALWVHLDGTRADAQSWLTGPASLDDLVVEALLAKETRPRAQALAGGWLVVLRGVNLNPGSDPEDMVSIRLWSDGARVISTRMRFVRAIATLREDLRAGRGPLDTGDLVAQLTARLVDNMQSFNNSLQDRLDELEEQVIVNEGRQLLGELAALRRQSIILRRYLAPQRDAIVRLHGTQLPWIAVLPRAAMLEAADDVMRYVEDLDSLKDRAGILQDTLTNRISERMEQRMYGLSLIATIFLPLSFVTGLLGINVGGIPGSEFGWAFWMVVVMLVALSGMQLWALRRWRWF